MHRFLVLAIVVSTMIMPLHAQTPSARPPVPGASQGVRAFIDVVVIPMDAERVLPGQTMLVQDGWIAAFGPSEKVKVPAGAVRIDGRGKYLIPGLADMHWHMNCSTRNNIPESVQINELFEWLTHGVTTVRIMDHCPDGGTSLRLRARAAAGELWSPRMYISGRWYEGYSKLWREFSRDSVAAYVATYKAKGYDFIKVYDVPPDIFDSLVTVTRRLGVLMAGHVPHNTLPRAWEGLKSFEHLMGSYTGIARDTSIAAMEALADTFRYTGVWNTPTLLATSPRDVVSSRFVKALQAAGAGLLLGTDHLHRWPNLKLITPAKELAALVRAGLTPYEALVTGTRNPAQYFGTLDKTGTLAVGKRADLVLLNGNPLQDIRHIRQPAGVMIGGRWLARQELDRRLARMGFTTGTSP